MPPSSPPSEHNVSIDGEQPFLTNQGNTSFSDRINVRSHALILLQMSRSCILSLAMLRILSMLIRSSIRMPSLRRRSRHFLPPTTLSLRKMGSIHGMIRRISASYFAWADGRGLPYSRNSNPSWKSWGYGSNLMRKDKARRISLGTLAALVPSAPSSRLDWGRNPVAQKEGHDALHWTRSTTPQTSQHIEVLDAQPLSPPNHDQILPFHPAPKGIARVRPRMERRNERSHTIEMDLELHPNMYEVG